ncbi:MAG: Hsp20/alpha crystallin family protein [Haliscomenobacter sp.]
MWTAKIRNHAFERMGVFGHLIDGDHFLGRSAFEYPRKNDGFPKTNLLKKGPLFEMQIAVPGYAKEEIEIFLEDDVLRVRGKKNETPAFTEPEYILEEFDFSSFERCFKLNQRIAREQVDAHFENGVLTLIFQDIPLEKERTHIRVPVA